MNSTTGLAKKLGLTITGSVLLLGGAGTALYAAKEGITTFIDGRNHPELHPNYAQTQENNSLYAASGILAAASGLYLLTRGPNTKNNRT